MQWTREAHQDFAAEWCRKTWDILERNGGRRTRGPGAIISASDFAEMTRSVFEFAGANDYRVGERFAAWNEEMQAMQNEAAKIQLSSEDLTAIMDFINNTRALLRKTKDQWM